ncbi:MAG: phosphatidylglycerophosphatase A [Pirellulales bacterium]
MHKRPTADSAARRNLLDLLAVWAATGSYVGLSPVAPGTFGALVGLGWYWCVLQFPSVGLQIAASLGLILLSVPICTRASWQLEQGKDPGAIVLDEIATMPLVLLGIDATRGSVWAAAFVLHRLFDIAKPPPARQAEHLPAGWGILADDCVAAIYAGLALRACVWAGLLG